MIIAIDGPAGSGKSSVAKIIAQKMQFKHINTGAMYRAVAWKARQSQVDLSDETGVAEVALNQSIQFVPGPEGQTVIADGEDVTALVESDEAIQPICIGAIFNNFILRIITIVTRQPIANWLSS